MAHVNWQKKVNYNQAVDVVANKFWTNSINVLNSNHYTIIYCYLHLKYYANIIVPILIDTNKIIK